MAPIRPISLQCKVQMPVELAPFCAAQSGPDSFECADDNLWINNGTFVIPRPRVQASRGKLDRGIQSISRNPAVKFAPYGNMGPRDDNLQISTDLNSGRPITSTEAGALLLIGIVGLGVLAGGWTALAVTGLTLLACSPFEKVGDPVDEDRDGFISKKYGGNDCDDSDKDIHPGVTEICNGKDDNCDGNADEGFPKTLFCEDLDEDKYGDKNECVLACTAPSGYVDNNGDCDDTYSGIHPGVIETCNNEDDNCDGNTDEGLRSFFYKDIDGDGYGDKNASVLTCEVPAGYASNNGDCNDTEQVIHPGAAEICGNNKDDNCDGKTDERGCYLMERVSRGAGGVRGNENSSHPSLSADGRFVTFRSCASNLVSNDTNNRCDIFVYDRLAGVTERVSIGPGNVEGNGNSDSPSISADGRFVAFASEASNFVTGDTNVTGDVFVRDRQNRTTERASVQGNIEGDGDSNNPSISADGYYVAFSSNSYNFSSSSTRCVGNYNIFIHNRQNGETTIVSASYNGDWVCDSSFYPSISADGNFVAFASDASDIVPGDINDKADIFVYNKQTGEKKKISVGPGGVQGNGDSGSYSYDYNPSISANGRFVAFASDASNLVPGDTNGKTDIFVHDRQYGTMERISVSSDGVQGNDDSKGPSISADGRFVAFQSDASNLVPGDTNYDIFVYDRQNRVIKRVNTTTDGWHADGLSWSPSISADGRFVAFPSYASNLVLGDMHTGRTDIFVVGLEYFFGPLP